MTELGERLVAQLLSRLDDFDNGASGLPQLVGDVEGLLALLVDEADPEWIEELRAELNRLDYALATAIDGSREINDRESSEVSDAVLQLRLILRRD
jgi:hypothetical protein